MRLLSFTVPGRPKAKARPRFKRFGKTYPHPDTVEYQQRVVDNFIFVNPSTRPETGPMTLHITAYFKVPKNTSKNNRQLMLDGWIRPTMYPDWDNIGKIVSDALNGVAYVDDKQIVDGGVIKRYGTCDQVLVTISLTILTKGANNDNANSDQDDDLAKRTR